MKTNMKRSLALVVATATMAVQTPTSAGELQAESFIEVVNGCDVVVSAQLHYLAEGVLATQVKVVGNLKDEPVNPISMSSEFFTDATDLVEIGYAANNEPGAYLFETYLNNEFADGAVQGYLISEELVVISACNDSSLINDPAGSQTDFAPAVRLDIQS